MYVVSLVFMPNFANKLQDETMMTIHFKADLRSVVGSHLGMLHWIFNPSVSGFIIGYDLDGNQVLICNFDASSNSQKLRSFLLILDSRKSTQ